MKQTVQNKIYGNPAVNGLTAKVDFVPRPQNAAGFSIDFKAAIFDTDRSWDTFSREPQQVIGMKNKHIAQSRIEEGSNLGLQESTVTPCGTSVRFCADCVR